jgi:hypothetical protein
VPLIEIPLLFRLDQKEDDDEAAILTDVRYTLSPVATNSVEDPENVEVAEDVAECELRRLNAIDVE